MTKGMPFVYDENGFITNQKCYILTGEKLKYLISIFNSKLYEYCFRSNYPELLGGVVELSKVFFEKVPVKYPSEKEIQLFSRVVDSLHDVVKQSESDYKKLSARLDLMVYKLYDLTYDEALLVDPELPGLIDRATYKRADVEKLAE